MKKCLFIPMLLFSFILNSAAVKAEENPAQGDFQIDSQFNVPDVEIRPDTYVLDYKSDDVNGDGVKDSVILIGIREGGLHSAYVKNINVVVKDGKTAAYKKFMTGPIDSGYEPRLYLGDFNGDRVVDIFTSIAAGGSGGTSMYSITAFKDSNIVYLFNQVEFSEGLKFEVLFKDKFRVEVINKETKKKFTIDVSDKKSDYIELKVYNKKGKLLNPITGVANPISLLQPVNKDNNGSLELYSVQRLTGIANADTIGYATATWKYEENKFVLKRLNVSKEI